jgi:hypothetical protein
LLIFFVLVAKRRVASQLSKLYERQKSKESFEETKTTDDSKKEKKTSIDKQST